MAAPFMRISAIQAVILVLTACGASAPRAQSAATAELEALYHARTDSARARFTEADARFMTDMLHHHAQAVDMAQLAPARTETAAIRTLAARILSSQLDEMEIMRRWLRERGQAVPAVDHDHHGHTPDMPGMLSHEQLSELQAARGTAFDRLFLQLMIQHHRGAVIMVHQLFATDGAAQDDLVFRFASDVQVDQRTEIARMERMLAAMP